MRDDSPLVLEEALYERLGPVARRETWLWRWRLWALVMACAALVGLAMAELDDSLGWGGPGWWVLLALVVAAALGYVHWRVEQRAPDLRALARRIEHAHPELRSLLLTAIEQTPEEGDGRFGYLQEQVMREAVQQVTPGGWSRAVPSVHLWLSGLAFAVATAGLLVVAGRSLMPEMPALFPDEHGLQVMPGDAEVERGTVVSVLARFGAKLPSRATLVVRPRGRAPSRVAMTRTLADPVYAAPLTVSDGVLDYQIEYGGRRSRRFRVTSFVLPEIERIDARIAYPKQPEVPARELEDVRTVVVAEGARVAVTLRLNKPVAEARLVADDGAVVNLAPSGGRGEVQSAVLDLDRTRRFDIQLQDERKRANRTPPRLTIEVKGNAAPRIALSFPGRDVRVSPLEELTVEAKVSDDVGLVGYGVSYALAGKPAREVVLGGAGSGAANPRTETAKLVIPLEELGAQPDDLVSYHFWAEDVAGNGERRRIWSDMYFAEVRPFEERYQEGPSMGGQAAAGAGMAPQADLAQRQKEIINATWRLEREEREGVTAQELRNDVEVVRKGQSEVKDAAEGLRQQAAAAATRHALDQAILAMLRAHTQLPVSLKQALEAEQSAYAWLLRLRERDHQVTRGRQPGSGAGGQDSDRMLDELELKQKEDRYETRSEATAQEDQPAREDRQVLNRLRDLAERQKTLTERIKELQVALQQARPEEREELQRRLKRLREEQQEMLADMDDLLQRMDRPENRSRLAEARDALESTRARAAETSEALARGEAGRAVGAGTRTERALDKMREDLQRKVSRGLADELRELRAEARKLAQEQESIGGAVRKSTDPRRPAASTPTESRRLAQQLRAQKQGLASLLERMKKITEESERSSPLLSRKLYDAYRKAKLEGVERSLDRMGDLLEHSFGPQAAAEEARVREAIGALEKGVGDAAKGVLGDDAEALKVAGTELDGLMEELRRGPGAAGAEGVIAGEGFRIWADRLRDVQELLGEAALRTEATRILDRARVLRGDLKRHSEKPRWDLVETEVVRPLSELRDRVNEELRRVSPDKDKLAPIDRDPVPSRYSDLVRRYYKSLARE